jgi:hypothetical protein
LKFMNILLQTAKDTNAEVGLNYFLSLYGFPTSCLGNKIPLQRVPVENPVITDNQIHGWINWKDAKIPVFQKPAELSYQGEVLLTYTDGNMSYPCAVNQNDTILVSLDVFSHLGLFVSGYLENIWNDLKDGKKEIISVPFADYYGDFLFSCIRSAQKESNMPLVHKSFWPDGKICAVCLTHDVDEVKKTYQWITYPLKQIKRGKPGNLIPQCQSFIKKLKGHEPYWTFDEILEIEGSRDVKSSFYFLKETGKVRISDKKTWRHLGRRYDFNANRVRELIRDMNSSGWEVGLHGSFYSYTDQGLLLHEKEDLEHALGSPVTGGRQHNLNLKIPETWLSQEQAGLLYDTTLGYNDCCGFRWGISFPFRPYSTEENRSLNILEIPLAIEDLPYFRNQQPFDQFLNIFNHVRQLHGALTLLWHHSVFNDNEFPGWGLDYLKILDFCKKENAWIGSGRQIHEWWTRKEKTTIEWEYDEPTLKIIPKPAHQEHFITLWLPESFRIKKLDKATIINCHQTSCEIKTDILNEGDFVEVVFTES